jgi:hypothetical protein
MKLNTSQAIVRLTTIALCLLITKEGSFLTTAAAIWHLLFFVGICKSL